jgi:hypothetical protein
MNRERVRRAMRAVGAEDPGPLDGITDEREYREAVAALPDDALMQEIERSERGRLLSLTEDAFLAELDTQHNQRRNDATHMGEQFR